MLHRDAANANQGIETIFSAQEVGEQREYDRLKSQLVQQVAPVIYQKVGDQLVGAGPMAKSAVHALVGGLISQQMGGDFAAGAAGGAAASLAMEVFGKSRLDLKGLTESDRNALVQIAGALAGGSAGTAAGGTLAAGAAGGSIGKIATEHNYLTHEQKKSYAVQLSACKDDSCRSRSRAEYAQAWAANREEVENCPSTSSCLAIAQALRVEQQAQSARIEELQAEGPSN